ncbi:arabinose operon transcriptional regulator AraC [Agarivorans sp. MS3-6]
MPSQKNITQSDPLKPGYNFDVHLVSGVTPIYKNGEFDFPISRPFGMKGYIINITQKGRGLIFDGDRSFEANEGDLILFPPKVEHLYRRHPESSHWVHDWVYFHPRAYWKDLLSWDQQQEGVYLTSVESKAARDKIFKLFKEIESFSKSSSTLDNDLALNHLEQLLLRCKKYQPNQQQKPIDDRIEIATQFLSLNIDRQITHKEIAEKVCLSPSRLAHLFQQELGMTITQWRDDQRISLAKQLLVTTNRPINSISRSVGFNDPLYFSRVFKKAATTSPLNYRRKFTYVNHVKE